MTVFNFPDTTGQPIDGSFTWTAPSGVLYVWNGEAWVTQGSGGSSGGGSKVYVTDNLTTIADPEIGDLAYHTVEARLYVYYQDSDSQQWVDASPAGDANDSGGDSLWSRTGSTLSPAFTGDDLDNITNLGASGFINISGGVYSRTGDNNGKLFIGQQTDFTEVFSVTNTGDLSAAAGTFSGTISHASYGNYGFQSAVNTTSEFCATTIAAGTSSAGNLNRLPFKITYDDGVGSATKFAVGADGTVRVGGTISNAADTSTPNITLKANGSATFEDRVTAAKGGGYFYNNTGTNDGLTGIANASNKAGIVARNINASGPLIRGLNSAGNIVWTLSNTGNASYSNTLLNLDADNPANFNAEGEYTGPTLDVKDRILNLISRLDALEANEVIDDATDTSLLTLLANASSRLDSIEARLTALEGGN